MDPGLYRGAAFPSERSGRLGLEPRFSHIFTVSLPRVTMAELCLMLLQLDAPQRHGGHPCPARSGPRGTRMGGDGFHLQGALFQQPGGNFVRPLPLHDSE